MPVLGNVNGGLSKLVINEGVVIVDGHLEVVILGIETELFIEGHIVASFLLGLGAFLLIA